MKRILAVFIILCILLLSAGSFANSNVVAASNYSKLLDVTYFFDSGQEGVLVHFDKLNSYSDHTIPGVDEKRVYVDFTNSLYDGFTVDFDTSGEIITRVRYAQFEKTTVRVVLHVAGKQQYKIEEGEGYLKIYIGDGDSIDSPGTEKSETGEPANGQNAGEISEKKDEKEEREGREEGQASRGSSEREGIDLPDGVNIALVRRGNIDEVCISHEKIKNCSLYSLTRPDRIVVDIPGAEFPSEMGKIIVDGNFVKTIRYAQHRENVGRIVLDLSQKAFYRISEQDGKIILGIEEPGFKTVTYNNITYTNKGDRVYFSLKGAVLTEGGADLKNYYSAKYDSTGKIYTVTFPSKYAANLSSGVLKLNDHLFESVTIAKNFLTGKTSLVFKAREKLAYVIMTRPETKDTAITVLNPASKSDKLVVIDAGHGGSEPGAVYGKLFEKDINLDIALRLNELLKRNSINTYMIREDDSFVGLYERAHIANRLNAALFLSIHNNAMGDVSYGGTMTLYYVKSSEGKGFNSYNFARNIQNSLVKALGTKDRNTRVRPELVVLKATKMPAALAEIAFMTNAGDRQNLQKEEFRQRAAQALYDAIIKSLSEIK
jgi:N-acetylmuramoyl-L-alanine amidase